MLAVIAQDDQDHGELLQFQKTRLFRPFRFGGRFQFASMERLRHTALSYKFFFYSPSFTFIFDFTRDCVTRFTHYFRFR